MATMKAVQYVTFGAGAEVREVEKPTPGPGEVLLKVTAAGACHSDQFIMGMPAGPENPYRLPLTLGHEGAGIVEALGPGTKNVEVGEAVLVFGPQGCGRCHACAAGNENNCENFMDAPGINHHGAMAEYMIVKDVRHLVPLGDLDPIASASLTDAGLTPYHAIKPAVTRLIPGTTAVVIGVGGLGHVGVQILKAMTSTRIVALDVSADKLAFAREVGADEAFISDEGAIAQVRALTGGRGADVVFDFVGAQPTLDLAHALVAVMGEVVIVGVAQGSIPVGYLTMKFDTSVRVVNWGTRAELMEVVELARRGAVAIHTEEFTLDQATEIYERMHAGTLRR
ncbi:NAD(P)-dependent alcohol dehydrogenase [Kribbia dieselivorans]|uniref:NAD(P)-dependent alcohol dehydrogenase n=1 Tax=Kribbia dieselivorans TaxID=331526 RepID=UPI000A40359B|nr:NAD(P)-dependent alcohol dehydrogenase [Kribbia dieselivorans]